MAWLSKNTFATTDNVHADDLNNLANDMSHWGGNVNGGGYHLSNVIIDGYFPGAGVPLLSPIHVIPTSTDYTAQLRLDSEAAGNPARWIFIKDAVAESGSNSGSNFQLDRCDDNGNVIDAPIAINRATGLITFGKQHWSGNVDGGGFTLTNVVIPSVFSDPTTTLGDMIVRGASAIARLGVGADGMMLTADHTQPLGVKWAVSPAVMPTTQIIAGAGLGGGGPLTGNVTLTANMLTVFGRTGNVVLTTADIAGVAVPVARQVLAGAGMSGGGALSADVTLNALVTSVFGRTGAVVLTQADISAGGGVPSTRQVLAGSGMGGGGALSGDVTLSANVVTVFGRTGSVVLTGPDITGAGGVLATRQVLPGTGLSGGGALSVDLTLSVVADTTIQRLNFSSGTGSIIGARPQLNFIQGTNVTLYVQDNPANNRMDVTINSGGSTAIWVNNSLVATRPAINLVAGSNVTITGADNSTSNRVDVTFSAVGGTGGGGSQTPWLSAIDAAGNTLANVANLGVNRTFDTTARIAAQATGTEAGVRAANSTTANIAIVEADNDNATAKAQLVAYGSQYGGTLQSTGGLNAAVGPLTFAIAAAEAMRVSIGKRILIGTATDNGTHLLQVNGAIKTLSGGIVFPDGTTQVTAVTSSGQAQSPWLSDIDAANHNLLHLNSINNGGPNLGIGTTSPGYPLDVESGGSTVGVKIGNAQSYMTLSGGDGALSYINSPWGLGFQYNGATKMVLASGTGNIGINSNSPHMLYGGAVYPNVNGITQINTMLAVGNGDQTGTDGLIQLGQQFYISGNNWNVCGTFGYNLAVHSKGNGNNFYTPIAGSNGYSGLLIDGNENIQIVGATVTTTAGAVITPNTLMLVNRSGQVSIGNPAAAPTGLLTVQGGPPSFVTIGTPGLDRLWFGYQAASTPTQNTYPAQIYADAVGNLNLSTRTNNPSAIILYTNNATAGTEAMRITSTGNVGIGNAAPGYKLVVQGGRATFSSGDVAPIGIFCPNGSTCGWIYSDNSNNLGFGNPTSGSAVLIVNTLNGAVNDYITGGNYGYQINGSAGNYLYPFSVNNYQGTNGAGNIIYFRTARGTPGAGTASQASDTLLAIYGDGWTTAYTYAACQINMLAEAAWSSGSAPTAITFCTTPSGAVSGQERMRINNAGNVMISVGPLNVGQGGGNGPAYAGNFCSSGGMQLNCTPSAAGWGVILGCDPSGQGVSAYHGPSWAYLINANSAPLVLGAANTNYAALFPNGNFVLGVNTDGGYGKFQVINGAGCFYPNNDGGEGVRISRYPTGVYYSSLSHSSANGESLIIKVGNGSALSGNVFQVSSGGFACIGPNANGAALPLLVHCPNASNSPSLTTYTGMGVSFYGGSTVSLCFGPQATGPYGWWMQAQVFSGSYYPILLNPMGGRVGIAMSTQPGYALDVTGDINCSGSLRVNGQPVGVAGAWSSYTPTMTIGGSAVTLTSVFASYLIFGTVMFLQMSFAVGAGSGNTAVISLPSGVVANTQNVSCHFIWGAGTANQCINATAAGSNINLTITNPSGSTSQVYLSATLRVS